MTDITMCLNDSCPLAATCYRHKAKSGKNQSFAAFKLRPDGTCDYYWGVEG